MNGPEMRYADITDAKLWFDVDVRRGDYVWIHPAGRDKGEVFMTSDGLLQVDGDYIPRLLFVDGEMVEQ